MKRIVHFSLSFPESHNTFIHLHVAVEHLRDVGQTETRPFSSFYGCFGSWSRLPDITLQHEVFFFSQKAPPTANSSFTRRVSDQFVGTKAKSLWLCKSLQQQRKEKLSRKLKQNIDMSPLTSTTSRSVNLFFITLLDKISSITT